MRKKTSYNPQNHIRFRYKSAFSLSEVIVSITILASTIVAIANLTASNLQANSENLQRLQAYLLAKEGLELVRNHRDSLWLQNKALNPTNLKNTDLSPDNPLQTNRTTLSFQNTDLGFQPTTNGTGPFTRTITITEIEANDTENLPPHFEVISTVKFAKNKKMELKSYLTNWKHAHNLN